MASGRLPEGLQQPLTESATCALNTGITVPLDVEVIDGAAWVALPEVSGVSSWRLDARLYWRRERIDGSELAEAASSVMLTLPLDAYRESTQDGWLSRVRWIAVALNAAGQEVGRQELERMWVVWPDGSAGKPLWLDEAARLTDAPHDAWSEEALAGVASMRVVANARIAVEPPAAVAP